MTRVLRHRVSRTLRICAVLGLAACGDVLRMLTPGGGGWGDGRRLRGTRS